MNDQMTTPSYYCPMHPKINSAIPGDCPICGMSLEPLVHTHAEGHEEMDVLKRRFWLAVLLTIPEVLLHMFPLGVEAYLDMKYLPFIELALTTVVVWYAGWPIMKKAFYSFKTWQLNMFSLIGLGVFVSYAYSVAKMFWPYFFNSPLSAEHISGLYFEPSAVITTLVLLGQFLEAKALRRTTSEIQALIELNPKMANLILPDGEERKIAIEDVKKGDILRIKPGEKIPVDGTVKDGQSWINEGMVTGESLPVYKRAKDKVIGGTLNGNGSFQMIAEKIGKETLLAQMIQLVTEARQSKAPIQKMADRVAALFTPLVLLIALITWIVWTYMGASHGVAIGYAVSVLIIACPCALGLATPVSMVVGMGLGAKYGILIRDAQALELMEKVDIIVIDKTGTLTEGKPMLTKIFARFPFSDFEVLKLGASVEQYSEHPLAGCLVTGAKLKQIPLHKATNFQSINGKGVIARVDGSRVAVGNGKLLEELGIDPASLIPQAEKWQKEGQTVSFVALEYRAVGLLAISDPIKFTSERAIQQLHREKLKVMMATGDSKEAALAVAKRLNIDLVEAEVLPQDKMALVQKLQHEGSCVAMAGDGVNDAPAIAQADVGIAMGTGTDAAIQSAAITLLKGDLRGVVRARYLSSLTMCNVRQNLFLAFVYNIAAIPLAAGVLYPFLQVGLTPIAASIAMTLSSLSVIGNALRLRNSTLYD